MKAKNRMRYCAWCGEELGESDYSDPESCGKIECEDKVRDMYRQEREEAQFAAEQDDYERYR